MRDSRRPDDALGSDTSPIRPEWAVTALDPGGTWPRPANRSPTICGGTPWSSGAGLVAALSVRRARPTPAFTNRTSFVSPSWFVLPRADGDEDSVGGVGDVAPAEDAHLAPPHTRYEDEPRDHGVEADTLEGHLVGLGAAALADAPVRPRESQVRTRTVGNTGSCRKPRGAAGPAR